MRTYLAPSSHLISFCPQSIENNGNAAAMESDCVSVFYIREALNKVKVFLSAEVSSFTFLLPG